MKRLLTLAIVAIAGAGVLPAAAFADELVAESRVQTSYPVDTSYDYVSSRNALSEWAFGVGWEFDALAGLRTLLLFQSVVGRVDESAFAGDFDTGWGRQKVLGGLEWGFDIARYVRPYVRGGVGYSHQFLELYTDGPRRKDHAHDVAGFGSGGVNLTLPLPFGGIGVTSQVGYLFQTAATFDEMRFDRDQFDDEYEDEDPWQRQESSVGSLDTNGIFWDLGLHARVEF